MQTNSLLQELKKYTKIVADTGDLAEIKRLRPLDATTNPSLITKALTSAKHQELINSTLINNKQNIEKTIEDLNIAIGNQILALIKGRVSTEIDANFAYDSEKTLASATRFIEAYAKIGIDSSRVLIKIPATWQGIKAAEKLQKIGINCNLTLIFDLHQAQACADAGVKLISPFVGRILDWQKAQENLTTIPIEKDKGVNSVKRIYHYYKQHNYQTQIMGASFRNIEQICALAGCDFLTIAPNLLDELASTKGKLTPVLAKNIKFEHIKKEEHTQESYAKAQVNSKVTQELLKKGLDGFIQAKNQLAQNLQKLI